MVVIMENVFVTPDTVRLEKVEGGGHMRRIHVSILAKDPTNGDCHNLVEALVRSYTHQRWLDEKGIELAFCMFGCTPYLRKIGSDFDHWDECLGNPERRNPSR